MYRVADCDTSNHLRLMLKPGAKPVYSIEPGTKLTGIKGNAGGPSPSWFGELPFEVKGAKAFAYADLMPDGDIVIVSPSYRTARRELGLDTYRCAILTDPVYAGDRPNPVGYAAIMVG